nr:MAG: hypothetical protein [Bacteriophage sp.]
MGNRIYIIDIRFYLYTRTLRQGEIASSPLTSASGTLTAYPSHLIITGKDEQGGVSGVIIHEQLAPRQSGEVPFLGPVIYSDGRRSRLQLTLGHHRVRPVPYMFGQFLFAHNESKFD